MAAHAVAWRSAVGALAGRTSGKIGLVLTCAVLMLAIVGPILSRVDPFALVAHPLAPPSARHLMGTDALGRDLLSGILTGTRTSLTVALAVSALAFVCGITVGLIGGYRGGWVDGLCTRITELLQVLPRFFLVIIAVALFGPGIDRLIVTLGLTSWPLLARVVRGEVLSLRQGEFVIAAQASGATTWRILCGTILPNLLPHALVVVALLFGQVLLLEASLGFLGLGDPNVMSLGTLAGQAQPFLRVAWWMPFFPGLVILMAVLGLNLLTDAFSVSVGAP